MFKCTPLFNNFFHHKISKKLYFSHIKDVYNEKVDGNNLTIKGWVKAIRKMKNKIFFDVSDGSSHKVLQVVSNKDNTPKGLTTGSSVEVNGTLRNVATINQLELQAEYVKLLGICNHEDGYPLAKKTAALTPEYVREHINLRPRTNSFGSLLRLRDKIFRQIHDYFENKQFIFIHTPVITSNDCEGAGEVFKVIPHNEDVIKKMMREDKQQETDEVFFNSKVYLTVSGQLNLECAARSLSKVYCFGPTFRAENSKSRLHLAEFYMVEAEIAFINGLEDVLSIIEDFIKTTTTNVLNKYEDELTFYRKFSGSTDLNILNNIIKHDFKVLSYDEVISILHNNEKQFTNLAVPDRLLSKEHELFLVKYCGNVPTFVINFPADIKPFYVKRLDEDSTKAASVDLLFPDVGEVCGGSVRENDYNKLKGRLEELNMLNTLNWYLDLRKFGNVLTGGFGMGFERYLAVLLGIQNIKDTIPFPRWPHNCKC